MSIHLQLAVFSLLIAICGFAAEPITLFDFTQNKHGWTGNPRTRFETAQNGLALELIGEDPWIEGALTKIPGTDGALKLRVILNATCSNSGECRLYFAAPGKNFSEEHAENLSLISKSEQRYVGVIPLISKQLRLRIDPPGSSGSFAIRSIQVKPLRPLFSGVFSAPATIKLNSSAHVVETKNLRCVHGFDNWNSLICYVNGLKMLQTNPAETLQYWNGNRAVAVKPSSEKISSKKTDHGFRIDCRLRDADGSDWELQRTVTATNDEIVVLSSIRTTQQRDMVHLPWLTLFAGKETFGTSKQQALLPGVEYLADEPSSNEKEVKGTAANRRIVEQFKLCYPMMAISAEDRWISVAWADLQSTFSPVFDSPDRIFNSGGHLLGLWSPAIGRDRFQGELEVYEGFKLKADKTYVNRVVIRAGAGSAVTRAIEDYVGRNGVPPPPDFKPGFNGAVQLLAHGWLDSRARDGVHWRHAIFGDRFPPSQAPDVPSYLLWLAANTEVKEIKSRLEKIAKEAIATLPEDHQGIGGISHIKLPTGALLHGNLESLVSQAAGRVISRAKILAENDGRAIYKQAEGKPDYASTLGSDHCNGFTAMTVERMMQDATLTGDQPAIKTALKALDRMTELYAGQVPCGAQPWEMPLHTPDIVASGILIRSYVMGFLLSGREAYLEQARYWAWTGAAMVYLAPPVEGEIGVYATIGVIGATNWTAPNWIGQPVQWCGLVYRSALEELARVDKRQGDIWRSIARGITLAGLQMTFPAGDPEGRGGLLPDYFLLKEQKRDGPAINPGTLQANLAEVYGKTPMYTVTRLSNGVLVHVPGEINEEKSENGTIQLKVDAWPEIEYKVLLTGVTVKPDYVRWNGIGVTPQLIDKAHAMIISLKGCGTLEF